jgi:hypothetical protein
VFRFNWHIYFIHAAVSGNQKVKNLIGNVVCIVVALSTGPSAIFTDVCGFADPSVVLCYSETFQKYKNLIALYSSTELRSYGAAITETSLVHELVETKNLQRYI